MGMKIAEFLLQSLEANAVRHIFGNPGTTEIPLVRACDHRARLDYVVALSEVSAVPMADGYARVTRSLGVVNLHVAPGLGNGMGNLYTASIARTPLLVLVGGQDRRFVHSGPILHGPLEAMIRPIAKAVFTLARIEDVEFHVRRAIRTALTPPTGPVALICPPDLLEEDIDAQPVRVTIPSLGTIGTQDADAYAKFLRQAQRPALVAGEDVHWAGASAALTALAEALGAPVYCGPYTPVLPVASTSPSHAGYLPPSFAGISERLAGHDALLFVGFRNFRTTLYSAPALPQRKAWIGHDPEPLAAEGEFELACIADLTQSLEAIGKRLRIAGSRAAAAPNRVQPWKPEVCVPAHEPGVFHPSRAILQLLVAFRGALVVDEAGLSTSDVRQFVESHAGEYIINGSGGIGWGLAAAVGAAIGRQDRQVIAIIGDGSSLYASEALWTAAHQGARILFVILSNRRYATLNEAAGRLTGKPIDLFSIEPPVIDFSGLATMYSLRFERCASEAELEQFLYTTGGRVDDNMLLELCFDPSVQPVTAKRHF